MVKKDKKAWLRIVEAFIAILIILGVILFVNSNSITNKDISSSVYEKQKYILDTIAKDQDLRISVLNTYFNEFSSDVDDRIQTLIPNNWKFKTKVCELDSICNQEGLPNDKDIYVSEIIISSEINKYEPKKLRFFVWIE